MPFLFPDGIVWLLLTLIINTCWLWTTYSISSSFSNSTTSNSSPARWSKDLLPGCTEVLSMGFRSNLLSTGFTIPANQPNTSIGNCLPAPTACLWNNTKKKPISGVSWLLIHPRRCFFRLKRENLQGSINWHSRFIRQRPLFICFGNSVMQLVSRYFLTKLNFILQLGYRRFTSIYCSIAKKNQHGRCFACDCREHS